MIQPLLDYFRISPDSFAGEFLPPDDLPEEIGFFQFGASNLCYGRCQSGVSTDIATSSKFESHKSVRCDGNSLELPFNFDEVTENLRRERYRGKMTAEKQAFVTSGLIHKIYYLLRESFPISIRRRLQKAYLRDWETLRFPAWPVDFTVDRLHEEILRLSMKAAGANRVPFVWFWPDGASSGLIMTHDVETSVGRNFTSQLMDLDDAYGFKASFQVIPETRYDVSDEYVCEIRSRGFEFNIHDLNHDGRLYREREEFLRRAAKINSYARRYEARGFRAGSMYRNQDWYDAYEFSYDMSVPNVAHLEPMRGGCCTVMPYFVGKIVELPLTTVEDYSLFHILDDYSIDLWKQQVALIGQRNGLVSFVAHPDYLVEQRPRKVYEALLDFLRKTIADNRIWTPLPREVDLWWRARSQLKLTSRGTDWEIEGPEKERASLAFAVLDGDQLIYELADVPSRASAVR